MRLNRIERYRELISENRSISEVDFRILFLEVSGNPFLGDLMIDFTDLSDETEIGPYSSIIIGPNGTGKSNILRALIQIFRELNEVAKSDKRLNEIQGHFQLIYLYKNQIYKFGNIAGVLNEDVSHQPKKYNRLVFEVFDINSGDSVDEHYRMDHPSLEHLPNAIIASSIMLTDKFPVLRDEDEFPIYEYLGVRRSPNVAGTRTYVRKTVDHLVNNIDDPDFIDNLYDLMDFLELERSLIIQYHPRYQKLLFRENENLTVQEFHNFFDKELTHPNRKTKLWGKDYYEKIKDDSEKVDGIVEFCNRIKNRLVQTGPRKKSVRYDLIKNRSLKEDFTKFKDLQALDFISYPTIILNKKDSNYNLEESSSGEYHLLSTLIGVLASIKQGSLVLIDEPEISLHPNWQMKFMYYIRQIFKVYQSCHFIICTHSHFLVSDLKDENSCVVALSRDIGNKITAETLRFDTYARSAEQVLLSVFKVPTTRNFFVSEKVGEILELISKENRDEKLIAEKVHELREHNLDRLSEEDPLKDVVVKLMERYI